MKPSLRESKIKDSFFTIQTDFLCNKYICYFSQIYTDFFDNNAVC